MNGNDDGPGDRIAGDANELLNRVGRRLGGRIRDFKIEITDKGLVLKGIARSYFVKQLAQEAVIEASAKRANLTNEIEVS